MKNYYKTLGVDENATHEEIEIAFKKFAKKYHPDNNPNEDTTDIMQEGMSAYQTLSNEQSRKAYDLSLKNSQHSPNKSYQSSTNKNKGFTDITQFFEEYFNQVFDELNKKYETIEDREERAKTLQRDREELAKMLQRNREERAKTLQREREERANKLQRDREELAKMLQRNREERANKLQRGQEERAKRL